MRLPRLRRPRLSYANVTATLALVLATSTGGAYAATMIGSSQIQDNAIKSRHIAAGNVHASDLGAHAVHQSKLGSDVAAARAYGAIWWPGSVTDGHGLATSNVTHPATGVYCISGLGFTPAIALANSAYEPNAFHHDVEIHGINGNWGNDAPCPTGSQIEIHVYSPGTTTLADGDFTVAIY